METHWTERSIEDYRYKIIDDYISQLEKRMQDEEINREDFAKMFKRSKSRISQLLNNPGNITFDNIVKLARVLKMKVSLVAYDDNDPENKKGPINSEIFKICWERAGKPQDFWAVQQTQYLNKLDLIYDYFTLARTDENVGWPNILPTFDALIFFEKTAILDDPEIKNIESMKLAYNRRNHA
jgi:transcriptional regulator with XRE-family HTH domain